MGALDKRIFSGVAIVSALLFVLSAVMLFTDGSELTADGNDTALYILTAAGVLTLVYSASMLSAGTSFVRKIAGVLLLIAGVLFAVVAFAGGNSVTLFAVAGLVAGFALVADMLALWVGRVFGAMYISAILAAVNLAMGAMTLFGEYQASYALIMLLAFAIWLAVSGWVSGFVKETAVVKTREVVDDAVSKKKEKPQAQNKKATPKAKKAEPKSESKTETKEAPKAEPKQEGGEPAKQEPKAEPKKVRTVQLPKTPQSQAAIQKSQEATEAKKAGPKAEPVKEEVKQPEAPKADQKPPAKAMGDFMQKLMSSQDASRAVKKEPVKEEVKQSEAPKAEPKASLTGAAGQPAEVSADGPGQERPTGLVERQEPVTAVEAEPTVETSIEAPAAEEPVVEESVEPAEIPAEEEPVEVQVPIEAPEEHSDISEVPPVEAESVADMPTEEPMVEEPVVEESAEPAEIFAEEEAAIEEPVEVPEEHSDVSAAPVVEAEEYVPPSEPSWSMVTRDSSADEAQEVAEEPVIEESEVPPVEAESVVDMPTEEPMVEEPVVEESAEPAEIPAEEEAAIEEPVEVQAEASAGEAEAEEYVQYSVEASPSGEMSDEPIPEPFQERSEEVSAEMLSEEMPAEQSQETTAAEPVQDEPVVEEVQMEDVYTDNSPEALVRRAAWNKGLRCRRHYGDHDIPVAFVKGKVAVYVDEGDADTSGDDVLREEGWTVLRFNAAEITDGKAQGEEIATAVKNNTKAVKKKKARK